MAKETKGEVATISSNMPDFDDEDIRGFEGAGASQAADDNLIPLLRVLQDGSPQVKKREPEYIDGAEAGMPWLRTVDEIWQGDDGPDFIQCAFEQGVVEWIPRNSGGGFVATYPEMPDFAEKYRPEGKDRDHFRNPENGNELIETRFHFGLIRMAAGNFGPCVISFSSTGHTVSKGWMSQINNQLNPKSGKILPAWTSVWRLNTTLKKKNDDSWFVFDPIHSGYVQDKNLLNAGKALYQSVMAGEKSADMSEDADGLGETF